MMRLVQWNRNISPGAAPPDTVSFCSWMLHLGLCFDYLSLTSQFSQLFIDVLNPFLIAFYYCIENRVTCGTGKSPNLVNKHRCFWSSLLSFETNDPSFSLYRFVLNNIVCLPASNIIGDSICDVSDSTVAFS